MKTPRTNNGIEEYLAEYVLERLGRMGGARGKLDLPEPTLLQRIKMWLKRESYISFLLGE